MAGNQNLALLKTKLAESGGVIKTLGPANMDVKKFIRSAQYLVQITPGLQDCTPVSVVRGVILAARLGLPLEPAFGRFYLIPFNDKHSGNKIATPVIGYKGLTDLVTRSGKIVNVQADAVYQGDDFRVTRGTDPKIIHEPAIDSVRDDAHLIAVYAIATFSDGFKMFDVMNKAETDVIRSRSRASSSGPWITDTIAMRLKTVTRRLCRSIPYDVDSALAVAIDDRVESGESADDVIDGEFQDVTDAPKTEAAPAVKQADRIAENLKKGPGRPKKEEPTIPEAPVGDGAGGQVEPLKTRNEKIVKIENAVEIGWDLETFRKENDVIGPYGVWMESQLDAALESIGKMA